MVALGSQNLYCVAQNELKLTVYLQQVSWNWPSTLKEFMALSILHDSSLRDCSYSIKCFFWYCSTFLSQNWKKDVWKRHQVVPGMLNRLNFSCVWKGAVSHLLWFSDLLQTLLMKLLSHVVYAQRFLRT
jgi:hypothetical protein